MTDAKPGSPLAWAERNARREAFDYIAEQEKAAGTAIIEMGKALVDAEFALEATLTCLNTWNGGKGAPVNTDKVFANIRAALRTVRGES